MQSVKETKLFGFHNPKLSLVYNEAVAGMDPDRFPCVTEIGQIFLKVTQNCGNGIL